MLPVQDRCHKLWHLKRSKEQRRFFDILKSPNYGVASVSRIDKIIGFFAKEPYKWDYILQKRPITLSILLTVATSYTIWTHTDTVNNIPYMVRGCGCGWWFCLFKVICIVMWWVTSHVWVSRVMYVKEACHIYEWVVSYMWMSHVTRMSESCHICEWVMSHVWVSHEVTR